MSTCANPSCGDDLTEYEASGESGMCGPCLRNGGYLGGLEEAKQRPLTSSRDLVPTSSRNGDETTSSLVPPLRGTRTKSSSPDLVPVPSSSPETSWRLVDLVAEEAEPAGPPDIVGLFYVGRNHLVSGESESAKSWLALIAAVEELAAGRGVLWVDGDDMGAGDVLERLRVLGAADEDVSGLFGYVAPSEPLGGDVRGELVARAEALDCRLVIWDGFNPLLAMHGFDPNSGTDVEAFYRLIDPFRKLGAANVITDNVAKSRETRGAWAIGSERKKSKAEVHLGMRSLVTLVRGGTGRSRIDVLKDRPGRLQRPCPGVLVLESVGDRCRWRIEPNESRAGDGGDFRPTMYMERVSRYLERHEVPRSRNQIENEVPGKGAHIRVAIDRLILEEHATAVEGPRGAKLVQLLRPFVEADDAEVAA
jgi:hypothetical protein